MDTQKKQVAIQGLRRSDPDTLLVLTQDVLRATLTRIEAATLSDLLALSELEKGLPVALARDLKHFRSQMFREVSDLPDSPVLAEFARDLAVVTPSRVPQCLRDEVARITPDRKHPEAVAALADLASRWEGVDPEPVALKLPAPATKHRSVSTAPIGGAPSPALHTRVPGPIKEKLPTIAPGEKKARTPVAQVDERRVTWIEEELISRLDQYGVAGLKEAVVVAGARHRAPWKDVSEDEVLTVLRRLKRENRVRFTSGRWSTVSPR